jgi:hypothetical protein
MPPQLAEAPWFFPAMLAAHLGVLVAWAWSLFVHARARPDHQRALVMGTAGVLIWAMIGPAPLLTLLPTEWFTPLQEGDATRSWQMVQVQGVHAGPAYLGFWFRLFVAPRTGPEVLLALHTWFGVLDLILLAVAVRILTESRFAVCLWLVVGSCARPWPDAMLSDQAATLCAFYLFPTLSAAAALADPTRRRRDRAIGAGCLVLLVPCLAALRLEMSLFPLFGLLGGLPRIWRWREALPPPRGWVVVVGLGLWAGVATTLARYELTSVPTTPHLPPVTWALTGLHPLNVSWWVALVFAVASAPPLFTALAGIGAWRALGGPAGEGGGGTANDRRPAHGPVPLLGLLALMALGNAFHSAGHGGMLGGPHAVSPYELYRYLLLLYMPWLLLAAWGWPLASTLLARRWPGRSEASLLLGLVVPPAPWLVSELPHQRAVWGPIGEAPSLPWSPLQRIDRDPQRALRFERAHTDDDCAHVMRFVPWFGPSPRASQWALLRRAPRTRVAWMHLRPDAGGSPASLIRELWPEVTCARLHVGLDCALLPDPGCEADARGLELLAEEGWTHLPYVHPQHERVHGPEIRLAVYELPLEAVPEREAQ